MYKLGKIHVVVNAYSIYYHGRYWMLDINDQLCVKMCMIIANLVMHVKEHEDWQLKVLQSWS
jgi:hypothetical protein